MSSDDETDIPSRMECERMVNEFVDITKTDEAFAQMMLQQNGWNLTQAVQKHFGDAVPNTSRTPMEFKDDTGDKIVTTKAPEEIKFLTWNIDGLSEKNFEIRTREVCNLITHHDANIVFLQEVVPQTVEIINDLLPNYQCHYRSNGNYFNAILLKILTVYPDRFKVRDFSSSLMGRSLDILECHIGKAKLTLINSHLESTKDHHEERVKQLKMALELVMSTSQDRTVIFGGDLNLRDAEVTDAGGLPSDIYDAYVASGAKKECRYTWDMARNTNLEFPGRFKPRCRFDRIYIRDSQPKGVKLEHFGLVGIERIAGTQSFPSDHWGILLGLRVNSN